MLKIILTIRKGRIDQGAVTSFFRYKAVSSFLSFSFSSGTWKNTQNYYSLLGISISASQEDIKKAYFKKAKDLHPDVAGTQQKMEERENFKRITEAYNALKDPIIRRQYDEDQQRFYGQSSSGSSSRYYDADKGFYQHPTRNQYRYDQDSSQKQYYYQQRPEDYTDRGFSSYRSYAENNAKAENAGFYRDYEENRFKSSSSSQYNHYSSEAFRSSTMSMPTWRRWKLHWIGGLCAIILIESWLRIIDNENEAVNEYDRKLRDIRNSHKQKEAAILRDNLTLSSQVVINDPPHVQEKRRQQFEQELQEQQVKIEVAYFDSAKNPYMTKKEKVRKFKDTQEFYQGQNALLEYAKNERSLKIVKSDDALEKMNKTVKPKRVTLTQTIQLNEGEDM